MHMLVLTYERMITKILIFLSFFTFVCFSRRRLAHLEHSENASANVNSDGISPYSHRSSPPPSYRESQLLGNMSSEFITNTSIDDNIETDINRGDVLRRLSAEDHRVTTLPGLSSAAADSLTQYAGHINVDLSTKSYFFYWLFEAASDPNNAPIIIWLNGGPGCSSMDGLFLEVGPLRIDEGQVDKLTINPFSWHNIANLLFVDQPVGTGLSFTMSRSAYPTTDDAVNKHFITFLEGFFSMHDKYVSTVDGKRCTREIIFAGESHAGHYIPTIVSAILTRNKKVVGLNGLVIHIKGLVMGNPWIDPYYQYAATDISHGLGLISLGQKYALNEVEKSCQENLRQGRFNNRVCFSLLDDIIESSSTSGSKRVLLYDSRKYSVNQAVFPPGHTMVETYLNIPRVRIAIHATACPHKYVECADNPYNALAHQDGKGVVKELSELLDAGVNVLIYAGQYDLICNHIGVEKALMFLPWTGITEWTKAVPGVWLMSRKPVGYSKSYNNLNYIRVMDSGHMVPLDLPAVALDMISRFAKGQRFQMGASKLGLRLVDPVMRDCQEYLNSSLVLSRNRKITRGRRTDPRST